MSARKVSYFDGSAWAAKSVGPPARSCDAGIGYAFSGHSRLRVQSPRPLTAVPATSFGIPVISSSKMHSRALLTNLSGGLRTYPKGEHR